MFLVLRVTKRSVYLSLCVSSEQLREARALKRDMFALVLSLRLARHNRSNNLNGHRLLQLYRSFLFTIIFQAARESRFGARSSLNLGHSFGK